MARIGCYPGSFDPPTVAHLAVAAAARDQHGLDRVDLVVSRVPLGKATVLRPRFDHRIAVLEAVAARVGWLEVVVSDHRYVADLAEGYDVVVMGADKWAQVLDPVFYAGSAAARDASVARLPTVAVAPRGVEEGGDPPPGTLRTPSGLTVDEAHRHVSSTAARGGRRDLMVAEAIAFDERTGAWTDPARYDAWLATDPDF